MSIVTVSSKNQIVIPKEIRERMAIVPKQKVMITEINGKLCITPVKPGMEGKELAKVAVRKKKEIEPIAKKATGLSKSLR